MALFAKTIYSIIINSSLTKEGIYDELIAKYNADNSFVVKEIDRTQNRITLSGSETGKHYAVSGNSISPDIQQGDLLNRAALSLIDKNNVKLSDMEPTCKSKASDYSARAVERFERAIERAERAHERTKRNAIKKIERAIQQPERNAMKKIERAERVIERADIRVVKRVKRAAKKGEKVILKIKY